VSLDPPPDPDRIRAARAAAGLTQTQAAELIHGTMRAWQQWEAGQRGMPHGLFELFLIKTDPDYPFRRPRRPRTSP
jgi:putative transcriptional regulator